MLTAEEAAAEMAKDESSGLRNNDGQKVISRLPSFRPSTFKRVHTRQPSFFQKMFSMRELDQALNGDDEDEKDKPAEGTEVEEKKDSQEPSEGRDDPAALSKKSEEAGDKPANEQEETKQPLEDLDDDDEENKSVKVKNYAIDAQGQKIYYPTLMVKIGQPIHVERLVNRNKNAGLGMEALMEMVDRDVREAIHHAKAVPVYPEADRVQVTPQVGEYMSKVRSRRGVEKRFANHMSDIQKALTYRKSSIIMMNSNYSSQLVRKIEPIYVQEARSIIKPT